MSNERYCIECTKNILEDLWRIMQKLKYRLDSELPSGQGHVELVAIGGDPSIGVFKLTLNAALVKKLTGLDPKNGGEVIVKANSRDNQLIIDIPTCFTDSNTGLPNNVICKMLIERIRQMLKELSGDRDWEAKIVKVDDLTVQEKKKKKKTNVNEQTSGQSQSSEQQVSGYC